MKNENHIEELIARVLSGEASHQEISQLEAWKKLSAENIEYYNSLVRIFELSTKDVITESFDTDTAWLNVQQRLRSEVIYGKEPRKVIPSSYQSVMRVAALIAVVAGITYAVFKLIAEEPVSPVMIATSTHVKEYQLPDSTRVSLNAHSTLEYTFSKNKRGATLTGEAYFELGNDPERPFELMAGTLTIRDIGTSFNVKAYDNSDTVIVLVTSGEVLITSRIGKSVSLVKGEQVIYYKMRDEFITEAITDTNALAYKTKIFVFENASMEVIVQKLSEVYQTRIILSENINSCHLTATFRNESLENILEIICETLKLKFSVENETIYINGDSCDE